MGLLSNQMRAGAAGAAGGGGDFYTHQIANSVRNSFAQNGTILRTPGTPSSTTTMTLSMWIQRQTAFPYPSGYASEGSKNLLFTSGSGGGYIFITTDGPGLTCEVAGVGYLKTNALLRDTSAFYHIVLRVDTTQGTTANRLRFYINGVEPTYSNVTAQSFSQNAAFPLLASGVAQGIGGVAGVGHTTIGTDTTFAEVVFNDGQSYGPDSYGEFKNGVWIPKDPSGLTFGNQGFHLNFASSGDLGNDVSGNNNDFAIANIPASDQLLSSPTFSATAGNGGNFATLGPLWKTPDMTFSEGNLKWATSTNQRGVMSNWSVPLEGKFYWEYIPTGFGYASGDDMWCGLNVATVDFTASRGGEPTGYSYGANSGQKNISGTKTAYGAAWATNDKIGVAVDRVNDTIQFSKNGSWQGSAFAIPATVDLFPWIGSGGGTNAASGTYNFGADGTFAGLVTAQGNADDTGYGDFYYAPPSGFLALCSGNLSISSQIDPAQTSSDYPQKLFSPLIWTGDGSTSRAITGLGFQPDWLWFKSRSSAFSNRLYDTTRGIASNGGKRLFTNTTGAEVDQTSGQDISAVGTDGFTMGASSNLYNNDTNSGGLNVGWLWRANGGTTVSNSNGDITSTVQTDPSGHFSIVKYTGNNNSWENPATVGHGLNSAPDCILLKALGAADQWECFFSDYGGTSTGGATAANASLALDTDAALYTSQTYKTWGGVMPTSSVFTVDGNNANGTETEGIIAYCFANIEGFIKVGSYVGNADANGTFVYTGFRPSFMMCKPVVAGAWRIQDTKRSPFNAAAATLYPNLSAAEEAYTSSDIDILSNGFKMRASDSNYNQSTTFVYLAMAENPFKYSLAR